MASKYPSGMKAPVRPAPAPPPGRTTARSTSMSSARVMDNWDLSFDDPFSDPFPKQAINQPLAWPDSQTSTKKMPPPRPPPPKLAVSKATGKSAVKNHSKSNSKQPSRPSELLSNLFTRRGQKGDSGQTQSTLSLSKSVTPSPTPLPLSSVATASLIDLSSPPSSPTPTTRSSSDGLSVDSFGSDGTTSHSHHHSQVESGFEDDSELFGGFTATPSPVNRDPWGSSPSTPSDVFSPVNSSAAPSKGLWASTPQDPFSPPRKFAASPIPTLSVPQPVPAPAPAMAPSPGVMAFKPTIIRPKVKPNSSPLISRAKSTASPSPNFVDDDRSESPPMPSIPPPAPPAEILEESAPTQSGESSWGHRGNSKGPHCIALYDYDSPHADDLSFKEGEVIELVKELSDEWLRGRIGNREGIFPANFVNVVVPLSDTKGVFVTALYNFAAETWEDLDLQEGAKVLLLSRINNDWLYGECNGKRGQFPATFVDNVPSDLPMRS